MKHPLDDKPGVDKKLLDQAKQMVMEEFLKMAEERGQTVVVWGCLSCGGDGVVLIDKGFENFSNAVEEDHKLDSPSCQDFRPRDL